jgi:hypothetical protein
MVERSGWSQSPSAEAVLDILANPQRKPFVKEDGTPVVPPEKTT